jgi:hypothetical protein
MDMENKQVIFKKYAYSGKGKSRLISMASGEIEKENNEKYLLRDEETRELFWRLKDNVKFQ